MRERIVPREGDFICTDSGGDHPSDFNQRIAWYSSKVIAVSGDHYLMEYDDSWHRFTEFKDPSPAQGSESPPGSLVFSAIPGKE